MKRLNKPWVIGFLMFYVWMSMVHAVEPILSVSVDIKDEASLQRGAKLYMNYCSGCHSLRYMTYKRLADDLGLTAYPQHESLVRYLMFTSTKVAAPIMSSIPEADARHWFGRVPPDLSLAARQHSPNWLYTYLKSFYADEHSPFGSNNRLIPDGSMPNILVLIESELAHHSSRSLDSALKDLVTFLVYVAEPAALIRYKIGMVVVLYLCVFLLVAYLLKKSYWKNP